MALRAPVKLRSGADQKPPLPLSKPKLAVAPTKNVDSEHIGSNKRKKLQGTAKTSWPSAAIKEKLFRYWQSCG